MAIRLGETSTRSRESRRIPPRCSPAIKCRLRASAGVSRRSGRPRLALTHSYAVVFGREHWLVIKFNQRSYRGSATAWRVSLHPAGHSGEPSRLSQQPGPESVQDKRRVCRPSASMQSEMSGRRDPLSRLGSRSPRSAGGSAKNMQSRESRHRRRRQFLLRGAHPSRYGPTHFLADAGMGPLTFLPTPAWVLRFRRRTRALTGRR
jgi:hypothetical protein